MSLYIQNLYNDTIWVAFVYYDAGCGPTQFRKTGWWQVDSGDTFNAWNVDLREVNQRVAFYGESGEAKWGSGDNGYYLIANRAFDQCFDDNSNCDQWADFVEFDFGSFADVTVALGPDAGIFNIQGSAPES